MKVEVTGLNDREFKFLLDKIKRSRNIDFSGYRPQVLQRRIAQRLDLVGCATYWDYIMLLNKDPKEYDRLIESLTVKVSEFFRDAKVFHLLGEAIIPEIISLKRSQGNKKICAWSCGTAFGQEAYSIAMLFLETTGVNLDNFDLKIVATDVDKSVLKEAPWGSYDRRSLGNMKPHLLFKYFTQSQDRYVVSDRAREVVTFEAHDLISGRSKGDMDLILCRNLLIYFQEELQEKALANLYSALNPGGFLVLGAVEAIKPPMSDYFEAVDLKAKIYRKKQAVGLKGRETRCRRR